MAIPLWLVCFVAMFMGYAYAKCPPEQLVRPCSCSQSTLLCANITEQKDIAGVFRRIGNSKLAVFILENSRVDFIPASSLRKNQFRSLHVLNSTLVKLFDVSPPVDNRLQLLELGNATFQVGFLLNYLKPLSNLEILLVRDTEIPRLGKDFGLNLSENIRRISFLRTNTHSIDYAFVGKPLLEEIAVQNGSITTMLRASFPYPGPSVKTLSFDNNEIEFLPPDQFRLMHGLTKVTLANNKISKVTETVFGFIYPHLQFLILEGNPINCDCSIKWITGRRSTGKIVTGQCVQPTALAGKNIVDLQPSDFPDC